MPKAEFWLDFKTTPAVMAGMANAPWTMLDFVKMLEREELANGGRLTDYKMAASKKNSGQKPIEED